MLSKRAIKKFDALTKISLIFGALLIASSTFYYFVIFIPKNETAKIELQREEDLQKQSQTSSNQSLLQSCLNDVSKKFGDAFTTTKSSQISNEGAKLIIDIYQKQRDECFKKYPVK